MPSGYAQHPFPERAEARATFLMDPLELSNKRPDWCAKVPLTKSQKTVLLALVAVAVLAAVLVPFGAAFAFILLSTLFYLALTLYKLGIVAASIRRGAEFRFSAEEIAKATADRGLRHQSWPVYSILIPMYKEPDVLPQMVRSLQAMDYPTDRMDVQFLLEEDDDLTRGAAAKIAMPPTFRITVIPPSFPRTKPKACNIGLALAKGEYLVIYDAEDRPEPDQLKKAVLAFEASPPSTACVQSRLNFYNPNQNWLTRFFTGDYSNWFDLQLPGLSALRAVIPLGGTSNHFRTSVLQMLFGWDAYNVTEDCDLGVRLCRYGYYTAMLDTTTWEEACSSLPFWIRQRTRWIKGYFQTYFVHMRHPARLFKELGFRNFFHFQMLVGGSCLSFLLNPVFWILAVLWFLVRPAGLDALFPGPVFAMGAFCLFAGNFLFVYLNLLGCFRRGYDRLLLPNLLAPAYWVLMSVAGWRAFIQFFRNPFLWEKTQHALGKNKAQTVAPLSGVGTAAPASKPEAPAPEPVAPAASPEAADTAPEAAEAAKGDAVQTEPPADEPPAAADAEPDGAASDGEPAPTAETSAPAPKSESRFSSPAWFVLGLLLAVCAWFQPVSLLFGTSVADTTSFFHGLSAQVLAGTTPGRQALVGSVWWAPLPMVVGALLPGIAARLLNALVALLLVGLVRYALRYIRQGRARGLLPLSFVMAAMVLCGVRMSGFVAVGLAAIAVGLFLRRRTLRRLPAIVFLGVLPGVYVFAVWMLLCGLILGDAAYFLRPLQDWSAKDLPLAFLAPVPSEDAPETPVRDGTVPETAGQAPAEGLLADALAAARERSPYAHVFPCGYSSLALRADAFAPEEVTPVLDLHIEVLRTAYPGQRIFLLVPEPTPFNRFESHHWKIDGLYEFGAAHTLYVRDFPPYRLYELISAPTPDNPYP